MRSFLKEIEDKFIELENVDDSENVSTDDELDEISATGGVAGYNTPAAFAAPGKWKNKKLGYGTGVKESVNTPPTWEMGKYQAPEDEQEEYTDKFPFSIDDAEWQHANYEYPSVNLVGSPGTTSKKHKSLTVSEMLEKRYEQLIEGYRDFKSDDVKPSVKVKRTIQEIAKKLSEIETLVNYNTRLKTESGVTSSAYGPGTTKALTKISERLIKISEKIRSLGE